MMSIILKLTYRFNAIQIKIPLEFVFFVKIDKLILNSYTSAKDLKAKPTEKE